MQLTVELRWDAAGAGLLGNHAVDLVGQLVEGLAVRSDGCVQLGLVLGQLGIRRLLCDELSFQLLLEGRQIGLGLEQLHVLAVQLGLLSPYLIGDLLIRRVGVVEGLAQLGEDLPVLLDLVGDGAVGLGQIAVVGDVGQGLGQGVRREQLLQKRGLVGDVGVPQSGGEDLLPDLEFTLLRVLLDRELSDLGLEHVLLGNEPIVVSRNAVEFHLEGSDLRLGLIEGEANPGEVLLSRGDLRLETGLLFAELGQLVVLIGDDLGQALLFGDRVG